MRLRDESLLVREGERRREIKNEGVLSEKVERGREKRESVSATPPDYTKPFLRLFGDDEDSSVDSSSSFCSTCSSFPSASRSSFPIEDWTPFFDMIYICVILLYIYSNMNLVRAYVRMLNYTQAVHIIIKLCIDFERERGERVFVY